MHTRGPLPLSVCCWLTEACVDHAQHAQAATRRPVRKMSCNDHAQPAADKAPIPSPQH